MMSLFRRRSRQPIAALALFTAALATRAALVDTFDIRLESQDAESIPGELRLAVKPGAIVVVSPRNDGNGDDEFPTTPVPDAKDGYVVLSGLRVEASSWNSTTVTFVVPPLASSGEVYVRLSSSSSSEEEESGGVITNSKPIRIDRRNLEAYQPVGLALTETGLLGPAVRVEIGSGGESLFVLTGWDTVVTYAYLSDERTHEARTRVVFPQRITRMKLYTSETANEGTREYLFCNGDFGLFVYRARDLLQIEGSSPIPVIAVSGSAYFVSDVQDLTDIDSDGPLVAITEYRPRILQNTSSLVTQCLIMRFSVAREDIRLIDRVELCNPCTESNRSLSVAIDPESLRIFVGMVTVGSAGMKIQAVVSYGPGGFRLQGEAVANPFSPYLLISDIQVREGLLWIGTNGRIFAYNVTVDMTNSSMAPQYKPPVHLIRACNNIYGSCIVRWLELSLFNFLDKKSSVIAFVSGSAINNYDVAVLELDREQSDYYVRPNHPNTDLTLDIPQGPPVGIHFGEGGGRIYVPDEWAGIVAFEYKRNPSGGLAISPRLHESDGKLHIQTGGWGRRSIALAPASKWTNSEPMVYVAAEGDGVWGASRVDLFKNDSWVHVHFNWTDPNRKPGEHCTDHVPLCFNPENRPVSAVAVQDQHPQYVFARAHERGVHWGSLVYGMLLRYDDNGDSDQSNDLLREVDISNPIDPSVGPASSFGDACWPRNSTYAYMTATINGIEVFKICVGETTCAEGIMRVTPSDGWVELKDNELATTVDYFVGDGNPAQPRYLLVGLCRWSLVPIPGLGVFDCNRQSGYGGLARFTFDYQDSTALPQVVNKAVLFAGESEVRSVDIHVDGLVLLATPSGLGMLKINDFETNDFQWEDAQVDVTAMMGDLLGHDANTEFKSGLFHAVSFNKCTQQCAVKCEYGMFIAVHEKGVLAFRVNVETALLGKFEFEPLGFYPATSHYNNARDIGGDGLGNWGDPDVDTIKQPNSVAAECNVVFVFGWPGKIQKIVLTELSSPAPERAPSSLPSALPIIDSTATPTSAPSLSPLTKATSAPSSSPSVAPSMHSTPSSSLMPSSNPSNGVTPSPRPGDHSVLPSAEPNVVSTATPTSAPSLIPLTKATSAPSSSPSVAPSMHSTPSPMLLPSSMPSNGVTPSPRPVPVVQVTSGIVHIQNLSFCAVMFCLAFSAVIASV